MPAPRVATVFTHRRPQETSEALQALVAAAREHGCLLRLDPSETAKHEIAGDDVLIADAAVDRAADICFALGGDGTILSALRAYAGTGVPVFAVNFGEIGFLATIEPEAIDEGFRLAFTGEFEVLPLPVLALSADGFSQVAVNDVSVHRKAGMRVADVAYAIADSEIGRVRCDGLVISTPAGSTGYNLANGGPVMAWGVEGFVVSFIAPHSLTARALVVAPDDALVIQNRSTEEPAEVMVDGRPVGELAPGAALEARFIGGQAALAQLPAASFYGRLREKFGKLAS